MIRIAVLASGNGTNFEALVKSAKTLRAARICLLITDVAGAYARVRARRLGVEAIHIDPKKFSARVDFDHALLRCLRDARIDVVVLAGYMRILSPRFVRAFKHKILNIHPALLPAFPGVDAIRQAYDYGVKVTGVTVHLVDELVDHGPILMQAVVNIDKGMALEALEAKIHKIEHRVYPAALRLFINNKCVVRGRHVQVR